jgi:hypothetical protein
VLAPERPQRPQLVAGERMHARNAILLPSHMQQMVFGPESLLWPRSAGKELIVGARSAMLTDRSLVV